jgi:hypothetical protein
MENTFQMDFLNSTWDMRLLMRGHRHTHHNPIGLSKKNCALTKSVNVMLEIVGLLKDW